MPPRKLTLVKVESLASGAIADATPKPEAVEALEQFLDGAAGPEKGQNMKIKAVTIQVNTLSTEYADEEVTSHDLNGVLRNVYDHYATLKKDKPTSATIIVVFE